MSLVAEGDGEGEAILALLGVGWSDEYSIAGVPIRKWMPKEAGPSLGVGCI
jgi:hypothetical protein